MKRSSDHRHEPSRSEINACPSNSAARSRSLTSQSDGCRFGLTNGQEMQMYRCLVPVLALTASMTISDAGNAQSRMWGENYIPNTVVTTQDGKPVKFYDDLIKGKIVIISFIYTSCTDICPLTTARLSQLEDKLGDAVGRDIFMISMTVDPKRD